MRVSNWGEIIALVQLIQHQFTEEFSDTMSRRDAGALSLVLLTLA